MDTKIEDMEKTEVINYLLEENDVLYEAFFEQDKILAQSIAAQRELVSALNMVVDKDLRALSDRIVALSEALELAESLIGFSEKEY